jgi:hypothetical protein
MAHINREDYEQFHGSREYFRADREGLSLVDDVGSCAGCGCTLPKDDLEEVDGEKVCATCAREMRLMGEGKL